MALNVAVPVYDLVLPLILLYLGYLVWTRQDGRYPIALALILLVAAAVSDALGAVDVANTLATFVFFLLAGGVVVLLIEHAREARTAPQAPEGRAGEAPSDREPASAPTGDSDA